jgi:hypothetical protein
VCYLNEPIDDLLGLVWYPRPGQWVAFTTFAPVPWWGLFVYIVFFGAVPYLALRSMRRTGVTARSTWTWFVMLGEGPALAAVFRGWSVMQRLRATRGTTETLDRRLDLVAESFSSSDVVARGGVEPPTYAFQTSGHRSQGVCRRSCAGATYGQLLRRSEPNGIDTKTETGS